MNTIHAKRSGSLERSKGQGKAAGRFCVIQVEEAAITVRTWGL
jgi:hypothetical protein